MKTNLTITATFSSTTADEVTAMGRKMMEILKENGFETESLIESEPETRERLSGKWETTTPEPEDIRTISVRVYPMSFAAAVVNGGQESDNDGLRMPFVKDGCWHVDIDRATGRIAGWPKGVTAKTYYKSVDENEVILIGQDGETIVNYDGYVPKFLSIYDNGYGDYVMVEIEPDGHIKDFNFTKDDIYELMGDE